MSVTIFVSGFVLGFVYKELVMNLFYYPSEEGCLDCIAKDLRYNTLKYKYDDYKKVVNKKLDKVMNRLNTEDGYISDTEKNWLNIFH